MLWGSQAFTLPSTFPVAAKALQATVIWVELTVIATPTLAVVA
jgi:hypothetical protein